MRVVPDHLGGPIRNGDEIDLGGVRRLVSARRRWVIIPTLAALLASTAIVNVIPPRYTGEARIVLENQQNFMPGPERAEAGMTDRLDAEAVGSQVQIVTSRDLARKAIPAIGLKGNPEFDPLADGMGPLERVLVLTGLKRDPTRLSPEERILEAYFDRLTVLSPTKTRVLTIEFTSRDPELSARAANTIADLYLEFQSEAKRQTARSAAESLGALVEDLKGRVAAADARAEAFRSQSGLLLGANNTSINAQQLADVNTELARARTAQADAQAKANLLRDMLRQGRITEIPDVANNELVRRISEQRVAAKAQLALESRTLLPAHPRIKELTAQVADFDAEVRAAGEKTARSLDAEARIAGARVDNLSRALDVQKKLIGASGADEVQMRELDRAARALKDELAATVTKHQEALAREGSKSTPSDARIFSRAVAPQTASFPKKIPIVAFSTLAALLLSVGAVTMRGLVGPGGAAAPLLPEREGETRLRPIEGGRRRSTDAPDVPAAPEAAPSLRLADVAADIETLGVSAGGLILVMSNGAEDDGELALQLARRLVAHGRVILVAGDAGTVTPASDAPGLADLMSGAVSFADAIHRDGRSRLHVIPAGGTQEPNADIATVLDALKGTYDIVVLGAPRAMEVEDAQSIMQRTEIAVLGPGDASTVEALSDSLRDAGVQHVLQVTEQHEADALAAA